MTKPAWRAFYSMVPPTSDKKFQGLFEDKLQFSRTKTAFFNPLLNTLLAKTLTSTFHNNTLHANSHREKLAFASEVQI